MEMRKERVIDLTAKDLEEVFITALKTTIPTILADLGAEGPQKEWLTGEEGRAFLGWSKATMQRRRDDGTLPHSKIGNSIFYRFDDLLKVLEHHAVAP